MSVAQFHAAMRERAETAPAALTSTSTHDSKRSHDVRCRIAVLSEIAAEWETVVASLDAELAGDSAAGPDTADRRYLYETAVGVWPVDGGVTADLRARLEAYVVKAAREAKRHSSWTSPDERYEQALIDLVGRLTDDGAAAAGLVASAAASIECAGATNALASVLLKTTLPGVPDTYQGDDLWFMAMVDPDNRRPLDAAAHAASLAALPDAADSSLLELWRDGRVKQHVLRAALLARRSAPRLFSEAGYDGVEVGGAAADHVVGYQRHHGEQRVVVVAPRLVWTLAGPGRFPLGPQCWSDTTVTVPPGSYRDLLTLAEVTVPAAGTLEVASILDVLPVALLTAR
jgi:maltooligosyltrehalose synthase